jgi:hypothetical protein
MFSVSAPIVVVVGRPARCGSLAQMRAVHPDVAESIYFSASNTLVRSNSRSAISALIDWPETEDAFAPYVKIANGRDRSALVAESSAPRAT